MFLSNSVDMMKNLLTGHIDLNKKKSKFAFFLAVLWAKLKLWESLKNNESHGTRFKKKNYVWRLYFFTLKILTGQNEFLKNVIWSLLFYYNCKIEINVLDIWEVWGIKSFYISHTVSFFYKTEFETWAGFGQFSCTFNVTSLI